MKRLLSRSFSAVVYMSIGALAAIMVQSIWSSTVAAY